MLSNDQRVRFFVAMNGAWSAHCEREEWNARDNAAKDAWYRAEMERETGKRSVKDLNRVTDYDTMRLHWAIIANDESSIRYFGEAAERRLRKLIEDRMDELAQITERRVTWAYVRSLHTRMDLPLTIDECDAGSLLKILQALDTHRRRLRRKMADFVPAGIELDPDPEPDLPPPADDLPF